MPSGMCATRPASRTQTYSAFEPPRTPKTRSPGANSFTSAPTASTSPANSRPAILCLGRRKPAMNRQMNGFAARRCVSVRLTVEACTRTRISSAFGTGRSISATRRISGGP